MVLVTSALVGLLAGSAFARPAFIDELEHILVDTDGFNDAGLKRGVTPCSFYNQGLQTAGRMSSAQWMRVAFHDFATADVKAGTGGMDASIGLETNREENKGAAMNDSLTFFNPFVNKYTSMADMIALGTVMAVGACAGPLIPFKGGRVDATVPGAFGVPEPEGSLATHIARFATAGFNQQEMIQLTACGHTVGSVHQGGFPNIVQNAETPNNTNGGVHFDDTGDVFDNHVATTYLENTTPNPLVVGFNVTTRSDLRIFSSDNNVTMKTLASSANVFSTACVKVFTKMLNTVPRGVSLTDVSPIAVKPVNLQLNVDAKGVITFNGAIRLLSSLGFPANPKRTVQVFFGDSEGVLATFDPATNKGTSLFGRGDTFYHLFSASVDAKHASSSSFVVVISENTGRYGVVQTLKFPIQSNVFFLPSASTLTTDATGKVVGTIAAAVSKSLKVSSVTAALDVPVAVIGTLAPHITTFNIPLTAAGDLGNSGFTLYTSPANAAIPGVTTLRNAFLSSVDIVVSAGGKTFIDDFKKLSVLNVTAA